MPVSAPVAPEARALCVRRGGLGDTLLVIPILRAMRAVRAGAWLTFAGVSEYAELLCRYGAADEAWSSERLESWALRGEGEAGARARRVLQAFSWIVADDPALAAAASPSCRVDVFDPVLGSDPPVPAASQLLARAGLAGDAAPVFPLRPPDPGPGAPCVLHVGSGSARKCWPRARLTGLARALAQRGPLVVLAGPAEVERGWLDGWPGGVAPVVPQSIGALADVLAGARVFVGHDSGPAHLAAALGVPVVALFSTTDPRVWAPHRATVFRLADDPPPGAIADAAWAARAR